MVLSLTIVALVAAALLGGMYVLTEEPIAKAKEAKQLAAKTEVMATTDNLNFSEPADFDGVKVYKALDADGKQVGAAVETYDRNGFNGYFSLMVGFNNDGVITGYSVLEQNETPGLGANMVQWFKTDKGNQNIIGLNPDQKNMTVSKDGGDVDAITAATITSRAFLRAIVRAHDAFSQSSVQSDAVSGASIMANTDTATVELNVQQETQQSYE